jgi:hypothetical protein
MIITIFCTIQQGARSATNNIHEHPYLNYSYALTGVQVLSLLHSMGHRVCPRFDRGVQVAQILQVFDPPVEALELGMKLLLSKSRRV